MRVVAPLFLSPLRPSLSSLLPPFLPAQLPHTACSSPLTRPPLPTTCSTAPSPAPFSPPARHAEARGHVRDHHPRERGGRHLARAGQALGQGRFQGANTRRGDGVTIPKCVGTASKVGGMQGALYGSRGLRSGGWVGDGGGGYSWRGTGKEVGVSNGGGLQDTLKPS